MAEQLAGPDPGTAGELEHAAGWLERIKRLGHFVAAGKVQALVQTVRGQGPVVGAQLIQERADFVTVSCGGSYSWRFTRLLAARIISVTLYRLMPRRSAISSGRIPRSA